MTSIHHIGDTMNIRNRIAQFLLARREKQNSRANVYGMNSSHF